ncbi:MAG: hypothetical protein IJ174_09835 [Clostridia bacterium]|nr:hypothetical protein [Clostridia bacterium]
MKNLHELYSEIIGSDEMKKAFAAAAASKDGVIAFAKEHGVETTLEDVKAFLENQVKTENERLNTNELENAAGGTCNAETQLETTASVVSAGVVCEIAFLISAVKSDDKIHNGQQKDTEGRLCNNYDPLA